MRSEKCDLWDYFDVWGNEEDGYDAYLAEVTTSASTGDTYFTLSADSYTKITVVIWLEGQDADCLNEISGGSFAVKLGFTVAANNG